MHEKLQFDHGVQKRIAQSLNTPSSTAPTLVNPADTHLAPSTVSFLPVELIHEIFRYLTPHDYDSARHVCRTWFSASLYAPLLLSHVHDLRAASCAQGCGCPRERQSTSGPLVSDDEKLSLQALRGAFSAEIEKWPGSRVRPACGKMVLEYDALLKDDSPSSSPSPRLRSVEAVAFSDKAGSFIGVVTTSPGTNAGKSNRKLWIHRLFSYRHTTFGNRPRGANGELCTHGVEVSRCMPGQIYMSLEIPAHTNGIPIRDVVIDEHPFFSGVKEIRITYVTGREDVYTFTAYRPVRQSPENHLGDDKTLYYDSKGVTYKTRSTSSTTLETEAKLKTAVLQDRPLNRNKDMPFYVPPPRPATNATPAATDRLLVQTASGTPLMVCHRITFPLDHSGQRCSVLVSPAQEIFVCAASSGATASLTARFRLVLPRRLNETSRSQIRQVSVAPRHYFDSGSGCWWIGVAAAYENGEVIMWRVNTGELGADNSRPSSVVSELTPPPMAHHHSPVPIPGRVLAVARDSDLGRRQRMRRSAENSRSGDSVIAASSQPELFDPILAAPFSLDLTKIGVYRDEAGGLRRVRLKLPSPPAEPENGSIWKGRQQNNEPNWPYLRHWTLAYSPGIMKMGFVGKGTTLLAGNEEEVAIVEFRVCEGSERGRLRM